MNKTEVQYSTVYVLQILWYKIFPLYNKGGLCYALVQAGEQVEELEEENKSLIWFLLKQVRPGMDLSKVVLPTFILEPRSFLDKLSDYYYHADLLSK